MVVVWQCGHGALVQCVCQGAGCQRAVQPRHTSAPAGPFERFVKVAQAWPLRPQRHEPCAGFLRVRSFIRQDVVSLACFQARQNLTLVYMNVGHVDQCVALMLYGSLCKPGVRGCFPI